METILTQIAVKAANQLPKSVVREIRTPRSVGTGGGRPPPVTRWMWKRNHGGTIEAPPDERGGNRYVLPNATAPHLDSTRLGSGGVLGSSLFCPHQRTLTARSVTSEKCQQQTFRHSLDQLIGALLEL